LAGLGISRRVRKRSDLLRRFPYWHSADFSYPVLPLDKRGSYPQLADDFATLDAEVTGYFAEYDIEALRAQNRYRRQQVLVLLGSALVTGLGGLQAVFSHSRWPGLTLAVLGVAIGGFSQAFKDLDMKTDYLDSRLKAERLRALHFLFLSRTGPYDDADRVTTLQRTVLAIRRGDEPK
jgi:hypothetical protein